MNKDMNGCLPDRQECLELMDESEMLPNIKDHCLVVCRVALMLAIELNGSGESLDLREIEAAALLHDITKTRSIKTGENHAVTGARVLRDLGYGRIADIVGEHINPMYRPGDELTAEEVISYADKRVLHDSVVDLNQRFNYLQERYGRDEQSVNRIKMLKKKTDQLEHKILKKIDIDFLDVKS